MVPRGLLLTLSSVLFWFSFILDAYGLGFLSFFSFGRVCICATAKAAEKKNVEQIVI